MEAGKLYSSTIAHLACSTQNCARSHLRHKLIYVHHRSRQAIKKYVKSNNKVKFTSEAQFDSMFNRALKAGVEKGDFAQPKGTSPALPVATRLARRHNIPSRDKPIPED